MRQHSTNGTGKGRDRCATDDDPGEDQFVGLSPEEIGRINEDPDSPYRVPPAAVEAYANLNRRSPRLAYWVFESGNVGRVYAPDYHACRDGVKHDGAHELIVGYDELLKKYEACALNDSAEGEACGIIYVVAKTGQRIGSRDDTAAETYRYEKAGEGKGRPRRVVTGRVRTYGISTLRARHVAVDGDRVTLTFTGKGGQPQCHAIENAAIAGFFRRLVKDKGPDDPVFTSHIYRTVYVKFKGDTGYTIKDLRTAMAHLLVPAAKEEWIARNGVPATKAQEKKMLSYAVRSAAAILGNKPAILRKSYANPKDLLPRLE